MPLDPATVAHRWFEEAWNQGSERAIDELSADNVIGHGLGEAGNDVVGRDHFRVFWRNLRTALPDLHVTVEDTITQGEKVQSASSSKPPISAKVWACLRAMRA